MKARFFAPDAETDATTVALPDEEAEHLVRVLRLRAGDAVRVFNGRGEEFLATVVTARKKGAIVELGERVAAAPEARLAITLTMAVLKGDGMDAVIRDAVMLGVAAIRPLISERTEISAGALARGRRKARWQRLVISSAKQCGRAVVPIVAAPVTVAEALAHPLESPQVVLVEPSAASATGTLQELPATRALELFVGPEGGWTLDELQQAAASGAMLMTLGTLTLRADAAPIVAISALRAVREW